MEGSFLGKLEERERRERVRKGERNEGSGRFKKEWRDDMRKEKVGSGVAARSLMNW